MGDLTWGAGGSTADTTLDLVVDWKKQGLEPNMHLTCTNMDVSLVEKALKHARRKVSKTSWHFVVIHQLDKRRGQRPKEDSTVRWILLSICVNCTEITSASVLQDTLRATLTASPRLKRRT